MKSFLYYICLFQFVLPAFASTQWTEDERIQESQQIDLWRTKVANSSTWTDEEKLREFILGLECMSYRAEMEGHDPEIDKIYKQMQSVVASIPGHANFFTDKIEDSWNSNAERIRKIEFPPDWEEQVEKQVQAGSSPKTYMDWQREQWGNFEEILSKNLGVLAHIPSPESVRALGHYLRERDEPGIKIYKPLTGLKAAESLTELISDGPMQSWQASWEDVPKWLQWFDQVKAGKRTFRFVGSDVEYTLEGPADPQTLERIRSKNASVGHSLENQQRPIVSDTHSVTNDHDFLVWMIGAVMSCLLTFVFLFKRRNSRN